MVARGHAACAFERQCHVKGPAGGIATGVLRSSYESFIQQESDTRLVRTASSRARRARYRRDRRGISTLAPTASPFALESIGSLPPVKQ